MQVAGGGYDVAWQEIGSSVFTIWSVDSNGNFISSIGSNLAGNSAALENFETIFGQDLNGDGTIGPPPPPPPTTIQTDGTTTLVQSGNDYFLDVTGSNTLGPELKQGGVAVGPEVFEAVGAVQVAGGGYDVAWQEIGSSVFTIWSVDSNGNYISSIGSNLAGNSAALENFETIFGQDLNGDSTIGPPPPPPPTTIQTDGTTTLVQSGNNYFLDVTGSNTLGPELKQGGVAVGPEVFKAVGAVQVAGGGYDVAWQEIGSSVFTIWSVDSNGNFISSIGSNLAGNSAALENFETIFGQDLNGDNTIGPPPPPPPTTIQTDGTTTLVQSGNDYFLDVTGSNTLGPELKQGGVAVGPEVFKAVGAVQVAGGGYDVAWQEIGSSVFTIWSVDSNGNFISSIGSDLAGNSAALENFETIFGQDLNGDGTIGIYVSTGTTLQVTSALPSAVGAATIAAGATLELGTADTASITFSSSTGMLKLDSLTAFTGVIDNFTGNGSLSGSDQIDLKGINFNSVHDSYSNGILTVTDRTNTTTLDFNGTYVLANFKFASDGNGGTIVYDPPVPAQPSARGQTANSIFADARHDLFVFASDPAPPTFTPTMSNLPFNSTAFVSATPPRPERTRMRSATPPFTMPRMRNG